MKILAAMFAAAVLLSTPARGYDTACMLQAGCTWIDDYGWICPDPGTYSLCMGGP